MAMVYLDTSFFSACVSRRDDPRSQTWRAASERWWREHRTIHDIYISSEVIAELSARAFPDREAALDLTDDATILAVTAEVQGLARIFVAEKVMPSPAVAGDALHVALATAHHMEFLLSWNVEHLANPNKRAHFVNVCVRLGMFPPQIITPDMLE